MAASYQNPSEYISHHLTFFTKSVGEGGFWTLHLDTILVSVVLGLIAFGLFCWVAKSATAGLPKKGQALTEYLVFEFVDNQVKGIFPGDRHKFVSPFALTVFFWVLLMNAMDFLPADLIAPATSAIPHAEHGFRIVPTADVNTTFALALSVWVVMIFYAIKVKGLGGWIHELFCAPFGSHPALWLFNFLFNVVEYISKPLSHSLRLFGNMYAGEIIFLLLWLMATAGLVWAGLSFLLAWVWMMFHILIVILQAYIFMMLTVVYIQMSHEGH